MNPARPVIQSGAFVRSGAGFRLRIVSEPSNRSSIGTVVFVHAFAEEMNKSRRMAALMSRVLAGEGWTVVQRDLHGCGDSSGEFSQATWADWLQDVQEELSLANVRKPVWLWCQRAGALLAPAALTSYPQTSLLLWNPVMSGAVHLQQFLRLHAGARIIGSAKAAGSPSPMQMLRSGASVEVGGYGLHPALAAGMEQASFELPESFVGRVVWFEVSAQETLDLPLHAVRCSDQLRERGIDIQCEILRGRAFWQTQEIEECAVLLERSRAALCDAAPMGAAAMGEAARAGSLLAGSVAP
jgi:uncharacterized protein